MTSWKSVAPAFSLLSTTERSILVRPFSRRRSTRVVCRASSRVGHRSSARGPPASCRCRIVMMGSRKASVLPEPVGAMASSSAPCARQERGQQTAE
eukprot:1195313-Prorocentrum_minimum.AAC.6